jgi:hypothetical protein
MGLTLRKCTGQPQMTRTPNMGQQAVNFLPRRWKSGLGIGGGLVPIAVPVVIAEGGDL